MHDVIDGSDNFFEKFTKGDHPALGSRMAPGRRLPEKGNTPKTTPSTVMGVDVGVLTIGKTLEEMALIC